MYGDEDMLILELALHVMVKYGSLFNINLAIGSL